MFGKRKSKVFVGLSGGVDSAVSAALLKEAGYDVTGAFIRIAIEGYPCTAGQDRIDAQRVAAHLGIPFIEVDLSKEYQQHIFEYSVAEFGKGRTPNPDVLCNREIKFGLFYQFAKQHGAEWIATGHYAQLKNGLLYIGADKEKDQSYFLSLVPQAVLRDTLFPVGHLQKAEVRRMAKKFDLPNAERKDSQGLCFLGPVSMHDMLAQELRLVPGNVLDESGAIIGTHEGVPAYTLGQRHGFAVARSTPQSVPLYVVGKDVERNELVVSPQKFPSDASSTEMLLEEFNWIGETPDDPYLARYRYRQELIPAQYTRTVVTLLEPHYVPVGQLLALYDGDRLCGGGIVDATVVA